MSASNLSIVPTRPTGSYPEHGVVLIYPTNKHARQLSCRLWKGRDTLPPPVKGLLQSHLRGNRKPKDPDESESSNSDTTAPPPSPNDVTWAGYALTLDNIQEEILGWAIGDPLSKDISYIPTALSILTAYPKADFTGMGASHVVILIHRGTGMPMLRCENTNERVFILEPGSWRRLHPGQLRILDRNLVFRIGKHEHRAVVCRYDYKSAKYEAYITRRNALIANSGSPMPDTRLCAMPRAGGSFLGIGDITIHGSLKDSVPGNMKIGVNNKTGYAHSV